MAISNSSPAAASPGPARELYVSCAYDKSNGSSTQFVELMQRALAAAPRRDARGDAPPAPANTSREQSSVGMHLESHARPITKRVSNHRANGARHDSRSAPQSESASRAKISKSRRLSGSAANTDPAEGEDAETISHESTGTTTNASNLTALPVAYIALLQPKADLPAGEIQNETTDEGCAAAADAGTNSDSGEAEFGTNSNAQQVTAPPPGSKSLAKLDMMQSPDPATANGENQSKTEPDTNPAILAGDASSNPAKSASPNLDDTTGAGMNVAFDSAAQQVTKAPSNGHSVKAGHLPGMGAPTPPQPDGTSAAQGVAVNNKTEQQDEFAAPEKEVPHDERLAMNNGVGVSHATHPDRYDPLFKAEVLHTQPVASSSSAVNDAALVTATADPRISTVERTHDLVAIHAMRLHDANEESLRILLKPGGGLELSLELRRREGAIEARAAMQSGDFDHLNRHWPDLQQRLESRGIRLAPLTCADQFLNSNMNGSQQQPNRAFKDDASVSEIFPAFNFASTSATTAAPHAARATVQGWESWA